MVLFVFIVDNCLIRLIVMKWFIFKNMVFGVEGRVVRFLKMGRFVSFLVLGCMG